jgi:dienelactone hydrolase
MRDPRLSLSIALAVLALSAAPVRAQPASPPAAPAAATDAFALFPLKPGPGDRHPAPGVDVQDVSFGAEPAGAFTGEVVFGAGAGPHPGILFVHWLGDAKTTNHTEFEAEAVELAKRGVTSLLVDAMWAKPGWFDSLGKSEDADQRVTKQQLRQLDLALVALQTVPNLDPKRIAYVGHDFGSMMGALIAGTDRRPSWYVLMAGVPTLSQWYLLTKPAPPTGYAAALDQAFDLPGSLAQSKAKGFLFQFASHDEFVSAKDAAAFSGAAHGATVIFYDTDHALAVPKAQADRDAWLEEKLAP